MGFGLFKIAWQSEFLPREIMQIFSMLMYEETRHIVFFINWMAYTETRKGWLARTVSPLVTLRYYVRAVHNKICFARRGQQVNDGKSLAALQVSMFLDGFNFRRFLEDCYAENSRRMSVFDPELLRPSFLPQLADVALKALRLWGRRVELETKPGRYRRSTAHTRDLRPPSGRKAHSLPDSTRVTRSMPRALTRSSSCGEGRQEAGGLRHISPRAVLAENAIRARLSGARIVRSDKESSVNNA